MVKKMKAIQRLKKELDKAKERDHVSQEEIAHAAGIDPTTLSRIVTGGTGMPREATWTKIEQAMHLPKGFFLNSEGEQSILIQRDFVLLPVYVLNGSILIKEGSFMPISSSALQNSEFPERCFFIRITGNHFHPKVPHAAEILVERTMQPKSNDLVLAIFPDTYELKRVFMSENIGLFPELPTDRTSVQVSKEDLASGAVELYRILKIISDPN